MMLSGIMQRLTRLLRGTPKDADLQGPARDLLAGGTPWAAIPAELRRSELAEAAKAVATEGGFNYANPLAVAKVAIEKHILGDEGLRTGGEKAVALVCLALGGVQHPIRKTWSLFGGGLKVARFMGHLTLNDKYVVDFGDISSSKGYEGPEAELLVLMGMVGSVLKETAGRDLTDVVVRATVSQILTKKAPWAAKPKWHWVYDAQLLFRHDHAVEAGGTEYCPNWGLTLRYGIDDHFDGSKVAKYRFLRTIWPELTAEPQGKSFYRKAVGVCMEIADGIRLLATGKAQKAFKRHTLHTPEQVKLIDRADEGIVTLVGDGYDQGRMITAAVAMTATAGTAGGLGVALRFEDRKTWGRLFRALVTRSCTFTVQDIPDTEAHAAFVADLELQLPEGREIEAGDRLDLPGDRFRVFPDACTVKAVNTDWCGGFSVVEVIVDVLDETGQVKGRSTGGLKATFVDAGKFLLTTTKVITKAMLRSHDTIVAGLESGDKPQAWYTQDSFKGLDITWARVVLACNTLRWLHPTDWPAILAGEMGPDWAHLIKPCGVRLHYSLDADRKGAYDGLVARFKREAYRRVTFARIASPECVRDQIGERGLTEAFDDAANWTTFVDGHRRGAEATFELGLGVNGETDTLKITRFDSRHSRRSQYYLEYTLGIYLVRDNVKPEAGPISNGGKVSPSQTQLGLFWRLLGNLAMGRWVYFAGLKNLERLEYMHICGKGIVLQEGKPYVRKNKALVPAADVFGGRVVVLDTNLGSELRAGKITVEELEARLGVPLRFMGDNPPAAWPDNVTLVLQRRHSTREGGLEVVALNKTLLGRFGVSIVDGKGGGISVEACGAIRALLNIQTGLTAYDQGVKNVLTQLQAMVKPDNSGIWKGMADGPDKVQGKRCVVFARTSGDHRKVFVDPNGEIAKQAARLHGCTVDELWGKPGIKVRAPQGASILLTFAPSTRVGPHEIGCTYLVMVFDKGDGDGDGTMLLALPYSWDQEEQIRDQIQVAAKTCKQNPSMVNKSALRKLGDTLKTLVAARQSLEWFGWFAKQRLEVEREVLATHLRSLKDAGVPPTDPGVQDLLGRLADLEARIETALTDRFDADEATETIDKAGSRKPPVRLSHWERDPKKTDFASKVTEIPEKDFGDQVQPDVLEDQTLALGDSSIMCSQAVYMADKGHFDKWVAMSSFVWIYEDGFLAGYIKAVLETYRYLRTATSAEAFVTKAVSACEFTAELAQLWWDARFVREATQKLGRKKLPFTGLNWVLPLRGDQNFAAAAAAAGAWKCAEQGRPWNFLLGGVDRIAVTTKKAAGQAARVEDVIRAGARDGNPCDRNLVYFMDRILPLMREYNDTNPDNSTPPPGPGNGVVVTGTGYAGVDLVEDAGLAPDQYPQVWDRLVAMATMYLRKLGATEVVSNGNQNMGLALVDAAFGLGLPVTFVLKRNGDHSHLAAYKGKGGKVAWYDDETGYQAAMGRTTHRVQLGPDPVDPAGTWAEKTALVQAWDTWVKHSGFYGGPDPEPPAGGPGPGPGPNPTPDPAPTTPPVENRVTEPSPAPEKLVVGVTGHRLQRLGLANTSQAFQDDSVHKILVQIAMDWLSANQSRIEFVRIGMAQGWDLAVGEACARLKIKYYACIPFQGQDDAWSDAWLKARYGRVLMRAYKVYNDSGKHGADLTPAEIRQALLDRNSSLLAGANVVLALHSGKSGGTADAIRKATAAGIRIENQWDKWVAQRPTPPTTPVPPTPPTPPAPAPAPAPKSLIDPCQGCGRTFEEVKTAHPGKAVAAWSPMEECLDCKALTRWDRETAYRHLGVYATREAVREAVRQYHETRNLPVPSGLTFRIANKHAHTVDQPEDTYVGRPGSPLGNPWSSKPSKHAKQVSCREESIANYRGWLLDHVHSGTPEIMAELERIRQQALKPEGVTLVCWCHPQACHAEVIRDVVVTLHRNAPKPPGGVQVIRHDLWDLYQQGHAIGITTNGFVKTNGEAVMGAGCAKQAAQRFPGLTARMGSLLKQHGNKCFWLKDLRIFTFPVKHVWSEAADPALIELSAAGLRRALDSGNIPTPFYLPAPGCGNGKLSWAEVEPILNRHLDDRVVVVMYPQA